jgi:hypothetical protein
LAKLLSEARMITVNVLYPNKAGIEFDMTYYLDLHIPWFDGFSRRL